MSQNWRQSEIRIVINDKSQGSTAKHSSCDGLLHYVYITECAGERNFETGKHLAKVTGKMVDCVIHPIRLRRLSSKMQNSPDKLNNLCITDRNCC